MNLTVRTFVALTIASHAVAFVAPRRTVHILKAPMFDQMGISETVDEPSKETRSPDTYLGMEVLANEPAVIASQPTSLKKAVIPPTPLETVSANQDAVNAILALSKEAMQKAEAELLPKSEELLEINSEGTEQPVRIVVDTQNVATTPLNDVVPAVRHPVETETVESPSVGKILRFAVPAVGVWLCSPLLSLIDTSAVGILSGTAQQAALNPAAAVTDYAALLIAFMYTGTTNLIAAAWEKDKGTEASRTSKTLIGAMQLSAFVGAGLGLVLFVFARTLLRTIIGNDSINPAVFSAAMKYVRIRALGMPAAAMIGSAQAACLGMQDIKSPLYVLAAAAIVNFLGDMMFVGSSHPFIGGAAGAAWATVFSQYAALGMFVHWMTHPKRSKPMNLSKAILDLTTKPSSENMSLRKRLADAMNMKPSSPKDHDKPKKKSAFSIRGFLQGKLRKRDLVKVPSKETLRDFAPYILPVTTTQVGKVSGYVAMSHVVSSSLGTVSMAAQQVIVSLFYCLCPIADSLSLTAQSFVPGIMEKKPSLRRAQALRKTISNFMKAGGAFSAIMVAAVACIPFISHMFTSDPSVVVLVNMVAPLLVGFFSVHGIMCASEGLLLGQKDLGFLGKMYAGFFAVIPYLMLRVKRAAMSSSLPGRVNLTSVWSVFLGYQLFRTCVWALRILQLQWRTDKHAATN